MKKNTVPKIEIDQEKCDKDGLCALVCPWVFEQASPDSYPVAARPLDCTFCGHCVAVCPPGAIFHHEMDMEEFLPIEEDLNVKADTLQHFLRKRRSIRNYNQKRRVKRSLVEKIIEAARYAPTGSNAQTMEHVVVQDRKMIGELVRLCVEDRRARLQLVEERGP